MLTMKCSIDPKRRYGSRCPALCRCQLEGRLVGDLQPEVSRSSRCASTSAPATAVYYLQHHETVVLLLLGGDKSTQRQDISKAMKLAAQIREEQSWQ